MFILEKKNVWNNKIILFWELDEVWLCKKNFFFENKNLKKIRKNNAENNIFNEDFQKILKWYCIK